VISADGIPALVRGAKERGVGPLYPLNGVECERYARFGDAQPLGARVVAVGLALDEGLGLELAKNLGGHRDVGAGLAGELPPARTR
jgi:hypothetical protein